MPLYGALTRSGAARHAACVGLLYSAHDSENQFRPGTCACPRGVAH
ncbi:hypothetical protein PATSB16_34630 [Pandoraea thiooxydans]|nr:hypothetical protein PATSB16_34630 [Pandoraea thiooxydans]